ncbi:MAG: DEAD/DEAH box helicase, partial [Thermomicrobiales bacterium]
MTSIKADPLTLPPASDRSPESDRSGDSTPLLDPQPAIDQFAALYPFPLDGFQREAIATLIGDRSVMVAAPTGTGKTIVAEYGVYKAFERTGRVFYTTPI